jgi:hypothetical protein
MNGQFLNDACRPAFARHETFHPRFGWLKKAFDAADGSGTAFSASDATVQLGVGKNMVHAIRYWGLAYKVLEQQADPERPRLPLIVPSDFGRAMFSNDGWDPYLERTESLWLMHWRLLQSKCLAPVWWIAFNGLPQQEISEDELLEASIDHAAAAGWQSVVPASVKKDIDCLIRTFTVRGHGRQTLDDILDCPFRELRLMEAVPGKKGTWRISEGEKPALVPEVVLYASLDFMSAQSAEDRSISIARLATDPGSPGRAFGLTEAALQHALLTASQDRPGIKVEEPAGLRQLYVTVDDLAKAAGSVLSELYMPARQRLTA